MLAQGHDVRREVPYLSRSIDVVYLDEEGCPVVVELKLRDWRRGIQQASLCLTAAPKAYVGLPAEKVSDAVLSAARDEGVGVLAVSLESGTVEVEERLPAVASEAGWPTGKEWLLSAFGRAPCLEAA